MKFLSELDIFEDPCPHYLAIRLKEYMTVKLGCCDCDHPMSSSGVPCVVICCSGIRFVISSYEERYFLVAGEAKVFKSVLILSELIVDYRILASQRPRRTCFSVPP